MMKYRDIEYTVVQGIERGVWRWTASLTGVVITGQAAIKSERYPTTRHDHVDVWMMAHRGAPGVEYRGEAEGFWVARDAKGQIGGIFLLENSALSFAKRNSWPAGCATIFPSERFELDLENKGNPLVAHLGPLTHLAMRHRQRMAAFIRKMTKAVKRRLEDFHVL